MTPSSIILLQKYRMLATIYSITFQALCEFLTTAELVDLTRCNKIIKRTITNTTFPIISIQSLPQATEAIKLFPKAKFNGHLKNSILTDKDIPLLKRFISFQSFYKNNLTDTILSSLTNLSTIRLHRTPANRLTHTSFSRLTNLTALHIFNSVHITDEDLISLASLKILSITGPGAINGKCLPHLINLTKLEFTYHIFDPNVRIDYLTNLENLKISVNSFENVKLSSGVPICDSLLPTLIKLKTLYLDMTAPTTSISDFALNSAVNLTDLTISERIYPLTKQTFANATNLKSLTLYNCTIGEGSIAHLTNLKNLSVQSCSVHKEKELINLSSLSRLTLEFLSDKLKYLSSFVNLQYLEMTYVDNIYLGENLENLSSVRTLILKGCDGVKDNTLKNFISVDHLEISHLRIYGSSFAYLRKLTHLTINRCPILNTNMQYLSKITNLEIRCCPKISDSGINYLKNLREIIIEEDEPTLLTERAFRPLMFLKKIRIVAGSNITDWNNHLRSRGVMIVPKI